MCERQESTQSRSNQLQQIRPGSGHLPQTHQTGRCKVPRLHSCKSWSDSSTVLPVCLAAIFELQEANPPMHPKECRKRAVKQQESLSLPYDIDTACAYLLDTQATMSKCSVMKKARRSTRHGQFHGWYPQSQRDGSKITFGGRLSLDSLIWIGDGLERTNTRALDGDVTPNSDRRETSRQRFRVPASGPDLAWHDPKMQLQQDARLTIDFDCTSVIGHAAHHPSLVLQRETCNPWRQPTSWTSAFARPCEWVGRTAPVTAPQARAMHLFLAPDQHHQGRKFAYWNNALPGRADCRYVTGRWMVRMAYFSYKAPAPSS